jgi:hypothetical protein
MTDPLDPQFAATHSAASLSRLHRLLVVVVAASFGLTLSGLSFAASAPPRKAPLLTKPHVASQQPSRRAATSAPKSKIKAKPVAAQHGTQPRKTPTKARVAAKSKHATRAHQAPRKPTKLAKQAKHAA